VGASAADANDISAPEGLNHPGSVARGLVAVAQFAVVALAPAIDLAFQRESEAVFSAGIDSDL
jgi:hypothetical protein